uniref:Uncharacterized protein n=1 Tax=Timema monikensis TaxID=170555 RepID=A0A7R9HSC0_9NEOP|nr:unnamed protein product [Timema monikensis]
MQVLNDPSQFLEAALSLDFFLCHNMRQKKLYHSPSQPQLTRSDMSTKPESSRLAAGCVGRAPLPFEQVNVDERKLCARWRLMACQVNVVHTLLLGLIGISLLCFSFYSVPLRLYIKEEAVAKKWRADAKGSAGTGQGCQSPVKPGDLGKQEIFLCFEKALENTGKIARSHTFFIYLNKTSLQDVPEALNYSSSRDGHSVLLNIVNNDTSLNLTEHHNSLKGVPTKALLSYIKGMLENDEPTKLSNLISSLSGELGLKLGIRVLAEPYLSPIKGSLFSAPLNSTYVVFAGAKLNFTFLHKVSNPARTALLLVSSFNLDLASTINILKFISYYTALVAGRFFLGAKLHPMFQVPESVTPRNNEKVLDRYL